MKALFHAFLASWAFSELAAQQTTCLPVVAPPTPDTVCHNFTTRGTGAFPLYTYSVQTLLGRRAVLEEEMAGDVEDSVVCGYEMFPPEHYQFLNSPKIINRWPHRYVPEWMPSAGGVTQRNLGYPQGCGCTDKEVSVAMGLFEKAGCVLTEPFTAQAECFLFGKDVLFNLSTSVRMQCALRWTALFNYVDDRLQAFKDVNQFAESTKLGGAAGRGLAFAEAGDCPFAAGNTGLFILSKFPLTRTDQFYISPGRGIIYAQVTPTGQKTPTQVFCSHLTVNSTAPLIPSKYTQATFKEFQISKTIEFISEKVQKFPSLRVAYLGNPQFAVPNPVAPSFLVGNFPTALTQFNKFANQNKLVDAFQVQSNTKVLPSLSTTNPLTVNGGGIAHEGRNITVIHNYIGSACPADRHQAFQVFATPRTVTVSLGPAFSFHYTGYGADSFGVRTQVCERCTGNIRLQSFRKDYLWRGSALGVSTVTNADTEWTLEPMDGNAYALKASNGKYLQPWRLRDLTLGDVKCAWVFVRQSDGSWWLQSDKGDYLHRPSSGDGVTRWSSGTGNSWRVECAGAQCACPKILQLVCGSDGKTYSNNCLAKCAGVTVVSQGECRDAAGNRRSASVNDEATTPPAAADAALDLAPQAVWAVLAMIPIAALVVIGMKMRQQQRRSNDLVEPLAEVSTDEELVVPDAPLSPRREMLCSPRSTVRSTA